MKMSTCHPNRKVKVGGLCGACYDRELRKKNKGYAERQRANTLKWKEENPEKYQANRERQNARRRNRLKDPVYKQAQRGSRLKRKYNITLIDYEKMLNMQNSTCALCLRAPTPGKYLHVDHCHSSGRVRGLLCHQCNWFLGTVDSDPDILVRIGIYRTSLYTSFIEDRNKVINDRKLYGKINILDMY